jgi:methionyl-tRNA synthetase
MPSKKPFYITTTLPYVNADPHIGFAMEIVRADVIARYHQALGEDVFFNTGTDEHGSKIYEAAKKDNRDVQAYVDEYAEKFRGLISLLGITSDIHFIRTTDKNHLLAAQGMWKRCDANGDIYKKNYKIKYCIGCELEKTDSELIDGRCAIHPHLEIEIREEENYFFRFSKYQEKLLAFYEENPEFVVPDFRFNEIRSFVERGLEDFSISRLKVKMPWGVPVPGDPDHVMYVWFDALTSYISTLSWPQEGDYKKYWEQEGTEKREVVQYCGKDNLRQQSAMWQAMLMSSKLPHSTQIVINGFVNGPDGQKMSKSLGNVINPYDAVEVFSPYTNYPEEVIRFYLLSLPSFEDSNVSIEHIKEIYTAHLANGLGNLTNRIMKMVETYKDQLQKSAYEMKDTYPIGANIEGYLEEYDIKKALEYISLDIKQLDEGIQKDESFKVVKVNLEQGVKLIDNHRMRLYKIASELWPFMPRTSEKILECIRENKMPEKPLFARLS